MGIRNRLILTLGAVISMAALGATANADHKVIRIGLVLPELSNEAILDIDIGAKARAAIRMTHKAYGIRHYVIDHEDELTKVLEETGGREITIIVRLKTEDTGDSLYDLASKFGAEPPEAALA